MKTFWKVLGTAAVLSAVVVAVMATPKRSSPPKPELVTIEFYIGGNKFTVTGEVVDRFNDQPQKVITAETR